VPLALEYYLGVIEIEEESSDEDKDSDSDDDEDGKKKKKKSKKGGKDKLPEGVDPKDCK